MYPSLLAQMLAWPRQVITMASARCDAGAAKTTMNAHEFDVLQLATVRPGRLITSYCCRLDRYGPPKCFPVLAEDMLPAQTQIKVVLDFILRYDKLFVLIRDQFRVASLLGLSELNGNAFRIYVFSKVFMLELLFSCFADTSFN